MSNLTIHAWEEAEAPLLQACIDRAKRYEHLTSLEIFVTPRVAADAPAYKHPGWIEYLMVCRFNNGGSLTLGCIQRTTDTPFEFHS